MGHAIPFQAIAAPDQVALLPPLRRVADGNVSGSARRDRCAAPLFAISQHEMMKNDPEWIKYAMSYLSNVQTNAAAQLWKILEA